MSFDQDPEDFQRWLQGQWFEDEHHDRQLDLRRYAPAVSLFVPESPTRLVEAERDQALIDATRADDECPHGNLPIDGEDCGCWRRAA